MLVVHFVCPTDGIKIRMLDVAQPFKAAVDINVVDQKISQTIGGNAKANPNREVVLVHEAEHDTEPRRNGINQRRRRFFRKSRALPDGGLCENTT